jgi:tRNA A-37 threonylcarbamoyl transferase component Bud32
MFVKQNVSKQEYRLQRLASSYVNVPTIIDYNPKTKVMTMEKLGMNVADMYGDDVPAYLFEKMQKIIHTLFQRGIYYPDITGYNFIENEKDVYLIDFGHASQKVIDPFIYEFINGHCAWNPRFK